MTVPEVARFVIKRQLDSLRTKQLFAGLVSPEMPARLPLLLCPSGFRHFTGGTAGIAVFP